MKIYDRYALIKDYDNSEIPGVLDADDDKLEKLDAMLNEYNISHCFTFPHFDGAEPDPDNTVVRLIYSTEDEMQLELVYCLWASIHRNMPREKILTCFAKKAKKLGLTENE